MAARHLEEVLAEQPSGPYLLAGWSFGGLVAYEMSRQLIERGAEVARLVLLDTWLSAEGAAPAVADPLAGRALGAVMGWFFSDLAAGAGRDPAQVSGGAPAGVEEAPGAFFERCLERAVAAGVLPSRAVGERLFAVFRAHVGAAGRYLPRPLRVPAVLIKAAILPASPAAAELGLLPPGAADPRQRWHELIADSLEVQVVAGDHYTMLRPPHVAALAACLRRSLESSRLAVQAAGLT
jgi:thioesterase domain-containing protein